MARLEAAQADMAALRAGESGALRVGTYQSVGARILPMLMRRFVDAWPGIELSLMEPSTDPELYARIEHGELDLAFCSPPLPEGPFEALELMRDPYVLVVPADSELAERSSAGLAEIWRSTRDRQPVLLVRACSSSRPSGSRDIELDYAFRSDDNGTIQGLVAAGFGVALVPLLAVSPGDDRVRVLAVDPPVPPRTIAVVWHRDRHRSPAARAFIELAREVCEALERDLPLPGS